MFILPRYRKEMVISGPDETCWQLKGFICLVLGLMLLCHLCCKIQGSVSVVGMLDGNQDHVPLNVLRSRLVLKKVEDKTKR